MCSAFHQAGLDAGDARQIYFDDDNGLLAGIAMDGLVGVDGWESPTNPGSLPAGDNALPPFDSEHSIGRESGMGIDNEGVRWSDSDMEVTMLTVIFNIAMGSDYSDVEAAFLANAIRVGMHVQSINLEGCSEIGCDSSESIVTPIPGAVWLFGSALFGLVGLRRKQASA